MAVDNIGDNRHNQLLQLSIFLTAKAASQSLRLLKLTEKPALQSNFGNPAHAATSRRIRCERPRMAFAAACSGRRAYGRDGIEGDGRLFLC